MQALAPRPPLVAAVLGLIAVAPVAFAQPALPPPTPAYAKPLESWTNRLPKETVGRFVQSLPAAGAEEFAEGKVRVAVFGTDDVLWDGGPVPLETAWVLDRIRTLAAGKPEWRTSPPFSTALGDDTGAVASLPPAELARLTAAAVSGMQPHEVHREVLAWALTSGPDGRTPAQRARPAMRELLYFLRTWGFRSYVVSDGPAEVTRALAEALFDLPPYRVIAPPSPVEIRDASGRTHVVLSGEPAPPATGETRLRDVLGQVGTRPLFVAAARAKDAPLVEWAASRGAPFLALVFPETTGRQGSAVDSLRPAIPVGLWLAVSPSQTFTRPKPSPPRDAPGTLPNAPPKAPKR